MARLARSALTLVGLTVAALAQPASAATIPSTPAVTAQPNGAVNAVTTLGNTLYLGGDFTELAFKTGGGAAFAADSGAVDRFMPRIGGQVFAVFADGRGGFYIGGNFTSVGGVARNRVAHILADKSVDPSFDPSANGDVYALALHGSTLYVGGAFNGANSIGGAARDRIAALDASTGAATSWNPGATAAVRTLAVSDDGATVYAGGLFNGPASIGGAARNYVAALGAATGAATNWNPNASGAVWALALSGSLVYAGGEFNGTSSIGGADRDRIAALDATTGNATSWNPDASDTVRALAVSGSVVYAGGLFNGTSSIGGADRNRIAALDAATGAATGWNPDSNNNVFSLLASGSTVYAAGGFSTIGGSARNRLAALDASTGSATSWDPNVSADAYALARSGSSVYAGGAFNDSNRVGRNKLAALSMADGRVTGWNPNVENFSVFAVAATASTVYVGGNFLGIGGNPNQRRLAGVDRTTGAATFAPSIGGDVRALSLSTDHSTLYVGGTFTNFGFVTRNRIASFDISVNPHTLTGWDPNASSTVWAVAPAAARVYLGGDFIGGSAINGNQIAYHVVGVNAGTASREWVPIMGGGNVRAVQVSGSTIYAAGGFTTAGQTSEPRSKIAALDGNDVNGNPTAWNPGANADIYALSLSGTTLYAGGGFGTIGGATRTKVAALDTTVTSNIATSWNPTISGGDVYALAAATDAAFVGGAFTSPGYFAAFAAPPENTAAPAISGTVSQGQDQTCSQGTWAGFQPQAYSYRWLRDGAPIAGATAATYSLQAEDAGHALICRVTAENLGGTTSATSAARNIPAPPSATIATPADGSTYTVGQNVIASYSCDEGSGGPGIATCVGTVANGTPIDTATTGPRTFSVTATSQNGFQRVVSSSYTVVAAGGGGPGGGGGTGGPGGGTSGGEATISRRRRVSTRAAGSSFSVDPGLDGGCPAGGPACTATLVATTRTASTAARRRVRRFVIARARFTIPAGTTRRLRFRLNRTGARLLRRRNRLRATLSISARVGTARPKTTTARITIKRPRARRSAFDAAVGPLQLFR